MADQRPDFGYRSYEGADGDWTTDSIKGRVAEGDNGSDELIREDICDRLMQLGPLSCTDVGVTVNDGVVRLDGTIATEDLKRRVIEVVNTVARVRHIDDHLSVG